jgi:hypothetical protein
MTAPSSKIGHEVSIFSLTRQEIALLSEDLKKARSVEL